MGFSMNGRMGRIWRPRCGIGALAAALGIVAGAAASTPASAFVLGFGFPYPGFYAAHWPAYPPPPAYYPYYPPPPYYPAPPPSSEYYPPAPAPAATGPATAAAEPAAASAAAAISYTSRPAFQNAAGQTCREYQAAGGARGTACKGADGQWRVAN